MTTAKQYIKEKLQQGWQEYQLKMNSSLLEHFNNNTFAISKLIQEARQEIQQEEQEQAIAPATQKLYYNNVLLNKPVLQTSQYNKPEPSTPIVNDNTSTLNKGGSSQLAIDNNKGKKQYGKIVGIRIDYELLNKILAEGYGSLSFKIKKCLREKYDKKPEVEIAK